jgi:hypothetical protein
MPFSKLPVDMIHLILSYSEDIKFRHGKYMNRISKNDSRYSLLGKIKPLQYIKFDSNLKYFFKYVLFPNNYTLQIRYSNFFDKIIYSYGDKEQRLVECCYNRI